MFKIENVKKHYLIKKTNVITKALSNVSFKLPDKGMCFILGKSGSGKTTLFNLLSGMDNVDSGIIEVANNNIVNFKQKYLDDYRNAMIGLIFQEFNIIEDISVLDNIALPLKLQKKTPDIDLIKHLLKKVDLTTDVLYKKPNQLSGGQKQRVGIVRALVKNPDIIFADEPTGNLDSHTATEVFKFLKELSKEKLVIIISHDSENACKYADQILQMKDGQIISNLARRKTIKKEPKINISKGQVLTQELVDQLQKEMSLTNTDRFLKENFEPIKNQNISHEANFISTPSKFPFKFLAKTSLQSFNNKKIFLIFVSILLILIGFLIALYELWIISPLYYKAFNLIKKIKDVDGFYSKFTFIVTSVLCGIVGILIFMYFHISAKLQNKKISIFRSLGSRGSNIGKLFLFEGFLFSFFVSFLFIIWLLILIRNYEIFFKSFNIYPFSSNDNFELASVIKYITNFTQTSKDIFNNPENVAKSPDLSLFLLFCSPFPSFNPCLKILTMFILHFLFYFILVLFSIYFIIYRYSTKKPIDILKK